MNLTPREKQVADLLAQAMSDKQIAGALGVTGYAVNYFTRQIYRKLGVHSRAEALLVLVGSQKEINGV